MHDGSIATLSEVIDHYASGGVQTPVKSPRLKGFATTNAETNDLLAFLNSLTDQAFLSNPGLGKPEK
jgi:cytochrome c peroxidase